MEKIPKGLKNFPPVVVVSATLQRVYCLYHLFCASIFGLFLRRRRAPSSTTSTLKGDAFILRTRRDTKGLAHLPGFEAVRNYDATDLTCIVLEVPFRYTKDPGLNSAHCGKENLLLNFFFFNHSKLCLVYILHLFLRSQTLALCKTTESGMAIVGKSAHPCGTLCLQPALFCVDLMASPAIIIKPPTRQYHHRDTVEPFYHPDVPLFSTSPALGKPLYAVLGGCGLSILHTWGICFCSATFQSALLFFFVEKLKTNVF